MKAENLYKTVIQRQINKGIEEDSNGIIEMSLKLAKIYGEWKDHDKAKAGFDFCINAQETKMKSSTNNFFTLFSGVNHILPLFHNAVLQK